MGGLRWAAVVVVGLAAGAAGASVAAADGPVVKTGVEVRVRGEAQDGPSPNAALDPSYEFAHARLRLRLEAAWGRIVVHGVAQGTAAFDLPAAGAFGPGPVYTGANDGDTDPSQLGIAELAVTVKGDRFWLRAGRQGYLDAQETKTGVARLDAIKARRLSERLVGNIDFAQVGRRFDGASATLDTGAVHLAGYAFVPLSGSFRYEDALEPLDDLRIAGATVTGEYGAWVPRGEVRLFAVAYDDDRPGARAAAGGAIDLLTAGASLLAGGERNDLLLWGVVQRGDWGAADQEAWALLVEGGRSFPLGGATLLLRGGVALASGDDAGSGDHGTFFNLLPTNHKYYGQMDLFALSNLRETFVEALVTPKDGPWSLRLAAHDFRLAESADAWWGGSGAFDDDRLGYVARRPAGGFSGRDLGRELDLIATWKLPQGFQLEGGVGWFAAGGAGEQVLRADDDGTWAYVQAVWSR